MSGEIISVLPTVRNQAIDVIIPATFAHELNLSPTALNAHGEDNQSISSMSTGLSRSQGTASQQERWAA